VIDLDFILFSNASHKLKFQGSPAGALLFLQQQKKSKQKTAVPGGLPS